MTLCTRNTEMLTHEQTDHVSDARTKPHLQINKHSDLALVKCGFCVLCLCTHKTVLDALMATSIHAC